MSEPSLNEVVVVDIRMKFWSMVFFMVKWVIASIPALLILFFILGIATAVFSYLFGWGTNRFPATL